MLAAEGTVALGALCLAQFENLKIALRKFLAIRVSICKLLKVLHIKIPNVCQWFIQCDSLYNTCLHKTGSHDQQQSN